MQQNGVIEHRNQSVVSTARSLLKSKGVPARFWGEAVSTAVYLLNQSTMKSINGKTPYEAWHEHKPNVSYLCIFGCMVHVKVMKPHWAKLDDRSTPMVLFGYEPKSVVYRVYDPAGNHVHVTHDMLFDKSTQWHSKKLGGMPLNAFFQVDYSCPIGSPAAIVEHTTSTPSLAMEDKDPGTPRVDHMEHLGVP